MNTRKDEKLEIFLEKAEVIANFLHQQVKQGIINQALYMRQIEDFLKAYEDYKSVK